MPVSQEVRYLRNFIELQEIRSSDKLQLSVYFDGKLNGQQVYPLLMLPLVENAFKYVGGNYWINIKAQVDKDELHFSVANEEFLSEVRRKGERLRQALEQMIPNHDHIFDSVRGVGLMLGIRMKTDSRAFVNYLRTKGLLTVAAGDNVMRVLPPLVIEEEHIREFVETLSAAASEYEVPAAAA